MSTEVDVVNLQQFKDELRNVRSDESSINWMLAGHEDGNPNVLSFKASGPGGLEEMATYLRDDEVMYALVRLKETFDVSTTIKFVYVYWNGEGVPYTKKGRYGVVQGSVKEKIGQCHCIIETSSRADLTEEAVMKVLTETSGTKSMVMETSVAATRTDRGFTSTSNIIKTGKQIKGVQVPDAVSMNIDPSVTSAIDEVKSDEHTMNWCAAVYENNNPKSPIILGGKGCEGISEMTSCLKEDIVAYSFVRVTDVVDQISTVKFVFVQWVGEGVKPMTKGKISTHKASLEKVFSPAHVIIYATNQEEVSEAVIMSKVTSASGSKSFVK